ncbi:hypothetical protein ACIP2X_27620 [Streptomyces sp. NPDC089424]|uniref:effector-associated constant component EACC1 n=1 Tax=Streptomyces sp. NPDC089424 TaxID=3365917 RepID=UPI00381EA2F7
MTDLIVELGDSPQAEDDLRSLRRWLHDDEVVDGHARVAAGAPPALGAMGGTGFDALQLALGSGLSTASLVVSVLQWQTARRGAPAVTLRRGGVEVLLTKEMARDQEAVRGLVELLDTSVTPAPAPVPVPRSEETGGDDGTA